MDWFGASMTPLAGGYSGETFLVGDEDEAVVLRIYRRHPERAAIDASLLRLVRGIVAVPAVIEVRPPAGEAPAVLVTERLPGDVLDHVLREDPAGLDRETLGINLGRVLASLSGIPFLTQGTFCDATLSVSAKDWPTDLADWAGHHRDSGRLASWSAWDWRRLLELVDDAQRLLDDTVGRSPSRTVLAHSDFNPKNILVDPATSDVVGLVDWEFAHAGSTYTDFGNFTRFERDERVLGPLTRSFVETAPADITDPLRPGRAMDLWALIELAARTPANAVADLAEPLLLAQARSGDLLAWPWDTPRVDPAGAAPVS